MRLFKVSYYVIVLLAAGCGQREMPSSFLSHAVLESKERIVREYYLPDFHETNFPAPQRMLRRLPRTVPQQSIEFREGSRTSGKVALTFDACSTLLESRFDTLVAEILISTRTPATIFLGGKWVLDRPSDASFLASGPFFEIGNHTYLHGHLTKVSDDRLHYEILWAQEIIYTVTGKVPVLFRPPYLENDAKVSEIAARFGLKTICGDLPSGDPDEHATKTRLLDEIRNHVQSGSIIIMHINKGGKHTAEALPDIIHLLKDKGYELVTVSRLLEEH